MPYRLPVEPVFYEEHEVKIRIRKNVSAMISEVGEALREKLPKGREKQDVNLRLDRLVETKTLLKLRYQFFHGVVEETR